MENEVKAMAKNGKGSLLLKPNRPVGIISYGAYIPQYDHDEHRSGAQRAC